MAQGGDTITYTFSGSKETEDISNIDQIVIDRMDGADGEDGTGTGGSGGLIEGATADVSAYDNLSIYVGGIEFGHAMGAGYTEIRSFGPSSGGSTELFTDTQIVTDTNLGLTLPPSSADDQSVDFSLSNAPSGKIIEIRDENGDTIDFFYRINNPYVAIRDASVAEYTIISNEDNEVTIDEIDYEAHSNFIAAADGGGSGYFKPFILGADPPPIDGSQGARGDGQIETLADNGGTGYGGTGEDSDTKDGAGDGGQELGIASGGTLTTGGSSDGNGEIKISYVSAPEAPSNLNIEVIE